MLQLPQGPSQARVGIQRHSPWRTTGFQDHYPFFCIPTIALDHGLVDYQTRSVIIGTQRYRLAGRKFEILALLLFADGQPVTIAQAAAALNLRPSPNVRSIVSRIIRQLTEQLTANGQGDLLRREHGVWWLEPPRPAPLAC